MEIQNFSAETSQGPFLNINEDGYEFDFNLDLYTVLDGFGGNGVGDIGVSELKDNIKKFFQNFVSDRNSTLPFFYSSKYLLEANALINSALFSHAELYKKNLEKEVSARAGASGILVAKSESMLSLLSTGNCRAYLIRKGKCKKIFSEDSFQLLSQDSYQSHFKNMPLSGFGLFPDLHYQVKEVRVGKGDKVVLLTDGVYARVEEEEIMAAMCKTTINIRSKIDELFELSNNRGNLDNQTCMILEF